MRLSGWRAEAQALDEPVLAVVEPVLSALGTGADPHAWIAWGEDPAARYVILVPTSGGLVVCHVRTNVPGEGPRASAKLVRWSRAQLGELSVETQGGHRLVSFQVEGQVLRAADEAADAVAAFALALFAAVDGRPIPDLDQAAARTDERARGTAAEPATLPGETVIGLPPPGGLAQQ